MHEDGTEHDHYYAPSGEDLADLASGELVRLVTVGIDVGSATSHLTFSLLYLRRRSDADATSRYEVVLRELVHRSPIVLTPYLTDGMIDAEALAASVHDAYQAASLTPKDVDTGAVILTGAAARSDNAERIVHQLAGTSGRFVCASAGHHLEAALAAHGSGAVALSRQTGGPVLNVDIGGSTTKLALCQSGVVCHTAALAIGSRSLWQRAGVRVSPPAADHLADMLFEAIHLTVEASPAAAAQGRVRALDASPGMGAVVAHGGAMARVNADGEGTWLTRPIHSHDPLSAVVFSGGVAEYVYGQEDRDFGDLGPALGAAIRRRIDAGQLPAPLHPAAERIRATVFGASQSTTQLSGNAVVLPRRRLLPLRNLPVLVLTRWDRLHEDIAEAHQRLDVAEGAQTVALALPDIAPDQAAAAGRAIVEAMPRTVANGLPLILIGHGAIRPLADAVDEAVTIIALEGIELREFDYLDVSAPLQPSGRVAVSVKSLVFPSPRA